MKAKQSFLTLLRLTAFVLLGLGAVIQSGCSATGQHGSGGWASSRSEDLSQIYVYPLTVSSNLQLPLTHADTPKRLTNAIQQQLYEARRLQTDGRVHSLSLYGVVLSYRDGIIDVQGELYDDDKFLVYSRVARRLEIGEDWNQGLNLVAEQLLDELMLKLYPPVQTGEPPIIVEQPQCGFAECRPLPPDSYTCWGCWRDGDYDNGHHPNYKPKRQPHWVPGAILESLPRIPSDHPINRRNASESGTTGTTERGRIPSVSSSKPEVSTPIISKPSYEPPRAPEVSAPRPAPTVSESIPAPTRSTPSYEPPRAPEVSAPQAPVVRESTPASRTETPSRPTASETSRSVSSPSSPTNVGGSAPRGRDSSSSDGNSGGSSGGGRRR